MQIASSTARLTDQMVRDCDLDGASIFLFDRTAGSRNLFYLYHAGVSEQAQRAYRDHRVFGNDPYATYLDENEAEGELIRWDDSRLAPSIDRAPDYRDFVSQHLSGVVGAYVKTLAPRIYLLVSAVGGPQSRAHGSIGFSKLVYDIDQVGTLVTSQLLAEILRSNVGRTFFSQSLGNSAVMSSAELSGPKLSKREDEIVTLVCQGNRNKQIAGLTGLSENTIENYLRRIYAKLNINNRASLVAKLSGCHCGSPHLHLPASRRARSTDRV